MSDVKNYTRDLEGLLTNIPDLKLDHRQRVLWGEQQSRKVLDYIFSQTLGYHASLSQEEKVRLIQEKVLSHPSGSLNFFKDVGLGGFIFRAPFLKKGNSPLSALEWYDPQLFDRSQKPHLHEWDFSPMNFWNNEAKARDALEHILFESIGYHAGLPQEEKVRLIQEEVIGRSFGSKNFFFNVGLGGLISGAPFLKKRQSPLSALEWYDPQLFDRSQKSHLHTWDFSPFGIWKDEAKARDALEHILFESIGYHAGLPQEEKVRLIQEKVLSHPSGSQKFFKDVGLGGFISGAPFLKKRNSPLSALEWYDPQLFDRSQKSHLHTWDFSPMGIWKDEAKARDALEHILIESIGYHAGLSQEEKVRLIQEKVIGNPYFFKDAGLFGFMAHSPFLKKGNSPLSALEWYDPQLFDRSQKSHFHVWDFRPMNIWKDEAKARDALEHILFESIGYHAGLSQEEKVSLIQEKVLSHPSGSLNFFKDVGLEGFISGAPFLRMNNSPLAVWEWYLHTEHEVFDQISALYRDQVKKVQGLVNGKDFESNICEQEIPDLFFERPCIYNSREGVTMYNGNAKYPDVIFRDDETEQRDGRGITFRDTVIDIKRSLDGGFLSRTTSKGICKEGDIEKYVPLCNNLVFMVGEHYNPKKHDKRIKRLQDEFGRYAKPHQTMRVVFADEVINQLENRGHTEKAAFYALAVDYAHINKR